MISFDRFSAAINSSICCSLDASSFSSLCTFALYDSLANRNPHPFYKSFLLYYRLSAYSLLSDHWWYYIIHHTYCLAYTFSGVVFLHIWGCSYQDIVVFAVANVYEFYTTLLYKSCVISLHTSKWVNIRTPYYAASSLYTIAVKSIHISSKCVWVWQTPGSL